MKKVSISRRNNGKAVILFDPLSFHLHLGSTFITFNLNAIRRRKVLRELHIFHHNCDEPYCYSQHDRIAYRVVCCEFLVCILAHRWLWFRYCRNWRGTINCICTCMFDLFPIFFGSKFFFSLFLSFRTYPSLVIMEAEEASFHFFMK